MDKKALLEMITQIERTDEEVMELAVERQASLAKPPGSLGGLEEIAIRMAGITGQVVPKETFPGKGCVIVFCADNGVVCQGVTSAPQSVTRAQTMNFTRRLTGVGALSKSFGSELMIVDMGVKDPIPEGLYDRDLGGLGARREPASGDTQKLEPGGAQEPAPLWDPHKIIDRRIRPGTWDISEGPAMTEEEALRAFAAGIEMSRTAVAAGYDILGIGEMGIGNTTTSAAVLSCITGSSADKTCGRGGGVNDKGFLRKKEIVDQILAEWNSRCDLAGEGHSQSQIGDVLKPANDPERLSSAANDPDLEMRFDRILRILSRCGGFDIAAMTGAFLGAAMENTSVVIDGYISVVAALAAAEIMPAAADYMFASHVSAEPGYALAVQKLDSFSPGLQPFLSLGMRLGEGSGCPIAFEVIRGACDVMRNMATFEEAAINDDYLEEVRQGGCF